MSDYKVEISGDAKSDVIAIRTYIRDVLLNHDASKKFLEDTKAAVASLNTFPYRNEVRPGSKLFEGLEKRQYFYRKNFCLFYGIKEEVKTVRIIKVAYSPSNLDEE